MGWESPVSKEGPGHKTHPEIQSQELGLDGKSPNSVPRLWRAT